MLTGVTGEGFVEKQALGCAIEIDILTRGEKREEDLRSKWKEW